MPTYEYACDHCGHEFEQFQSITARPLRKCPQCGHRSLERLIGSGGGILFKGSGFYQTDYRSEAYKKAAEAEKKQAGGSRDNGQADKGNKTSAGGKKASASGKKAGAESSAA